MISKVTLSACVRACLITIAFIFTQAGAQPIPVLIDTDANNELDDQHALAYTIFNSDVFNIVGVTVNHTAVGTIQSDYDEAQRVMQLTTAWDKIQLYEGVGEGTWSSLNNQLDNPEHEGFEAVNFIIEQAHIERSEQLVLAPVGKLTNIALALEKDPSIVPLVKVIWLGGNYYGTDGGDGEHNLIHDTEAYNAVIESGVKFEMVTVRYGSPTGTDAVAVHVNEIQSRMPGLGPEVSPVTGRHGGSFTTFGDYSIDLFTNYTTGTRPLFDMARLFTLYDRYSLLGFGIWTVDKAPAELYEQVEQTLW